MPSEEHRASDQNPEKHDPEKYGNKSKGTEGTESQQPGCEGHS